MTSSGSGLAPNGCSSILSTLARYDHNPAGGGEPGGGAPVSVCGPAVPVLTYLPITVAVPPGSWSDAPVVRLNSPTSAITTLLWGSARVRATNALSGARID